jgi:hypothetical protein
VSRVPRPSPAILVALLALFIALGGGAYAAIVLPKNSVKSKHIVNGQVKRADIAKNAVNSRRIADASLLAEDFKPGQLPQGPKGDTGPQGETGLPGPPASIAGKTAANAGVSTSSGTYVDLGGPAVTVTVSETAPGSGVGLIEIAAQSKISTVNGNGYVALYEDGSVVQSNYCNSEPGLFGGNTGVSYAVTATLNGCGQATANPIAPSVQLLRVTPGTHSYSLRYKSTNGQLSTFENTLLWVRPAS